MFSETPTQTFPKVAERVSTAEEAAALLLEHIIRREESIEKIQD